MINPSRDSSCYAYKDFPKLTEQERDNTLPVINDFAYDFQFEREKRCKEKKWWEFK